MNVYTIVFFKLNVACVVTFFDDITPRQIDFFKIINHAIRYGMESRYQVISRLVIVTLFL